ncbi:MAG: hypothetical protein ABI779_15805 [Acidobacteriota bacterium]
MPELATLTVVGLIVLAVLVVVFLKVRQGDLLGAIMEKRRSKSKIVSRADYVEGAEAIPVAIALTDDTFFYENPDLEASFDLNRIDEIEYSDELMTGKKHAADAHVLRLRSHGTTFEFLLNRADTDKWRSMLPARTLGVARAG